jgi:hypothetical protein
MTCFRITIHLILQTPNTYLLKNGSTTFNQGLSEVVNVFEAVICRFIEYVQWGARNFAHQFVCH